MSVPRTPNDARSGASRVGSTISYTTSVTTTAWTDIDGGSDIPAGEYELTIHGASPGDVYQLTWASCADATEQAALGASAMGRSVWVNSPIIIDVPPNLPRLSVRALETPAGAGWTASLTLVV